MLAAGELVDATRQEDEPEPVADEPLRQPPDAEPPKARPLTGLARLAALAAERPGDAAQPEFRLWPEHVPALQLWGAVQSQWRHGMAGPTGLDWAGVRAHPACRRLPRATREAVLADVAEIEVAWLVAMAHIRQERANSAPEAMEGAP